MDAPRAARHALAPMLRLLVAVHVLAALAASRTFFQPDEYWQSLEIAHRWVFGYGYRVDRSADPQRRVPCDAGPAVRCAARCARRHNPVGHGASVRGG